MAAFSHSSTYDLPLWRPDSANTDRTLYYSSPSSEAPSTESYTTNVSYSKSIEETFKSKVTVTSETKSSLSLENGEEKPSTKSSLHFEDGRGKYNTKFSHYLGDGGGKYNTKTSLSLEDGEEKPSTKSSLHLEDGRGKYNTKSSHYLGDGGGTFNTKTSLSLEDGEEEPSTKSSLHLEDGRGKYNTKSSHYLGDGGGKFNTKTSLSFEDGEEKMNSELSSFKDKIRYMEKQREILQQRWAMLQEEEDDSEKDLEPIYLSYISRILGQVNGVTKRNSQTQKSLLEVMDSVNDIKDKFEDELSSRTDVEYAFVQLKKDVDNCSLDRTELQAKHQELKGTIELMKLVYEQELKDAMEESGDISVLLNMSDACPLNLESVVQEVKDRYETIAARSREEAQALSRSKLQQGVQQAGRYEAELENSRSHITQINSKIQRLRSEVLSVKNQCVQLEQQVSSAKANTSTSVQDANSKLVEVQEALQKAKQEVNRQLRDYQELMNVKLALDVEIATYKKLLEGEESRLLSPPVVNIHRETDVRRFDFQRPSRSRTSSSSWSVQSNYSDN